MPRRSRVEAPPPAAAAAPAPLSGSQPVTSAEYAATTLGSNVVVPWPGAYPGSSPPQLVPTDKQASQAMPPEFTSPSSDPQFWGKDPRPPGGYLNYLQHSPMFPFPQQFPHHLPMSQNFHFGSVPTPAHYVHSTQPRPSMSKGVPSPSSTPHMPSSSPSQNVIDVDSVSQDEEMRTSRRLIWDKEEDLRLMSSWLNNSNDPIDGNNKKNDRYWNDVVSDYNNTTPRSRWRSAKQAKDRWHTVNRLVNQFQYSWNKAFRIYSSGQSDDQLMDKAHGFYEKDWGGQFLLMNVWKAVRDQPKWHNYNKKLEEAKKKKMPDMGEAEEHASAPIGNGDQPRPKGVKAAKAERNSKGKVKAATTEMEELQKYEEIQLEASKNRSGILEKQQRLSAEKLETAKISHLAAEETKEARKHDKEAEMLRTYRAMATQDTSGMSDSMKKEFVKGLKAMRERLFGSSQ